jgi:hypothetical protein
MTAAQIREMLTSHAAGTGKAATAHRRRQCGDTVYYRCTIGPRGGVHITTTRSPGWPI